jgi:ketosteroid isomerase-like protein
VSLGLEHLVRLQREYARLMRAGDVPGSAALFAPDGVIWHNFDDRALPAERAASGLALLHDQVPDIDWKDVSVHFFDSGFVWQALLTGTAPGGPVRAHTCMVFTVSESGLIERLDEYLDPAGLQPLR